MLEERERLILNLLQKIPKNDVVLIGGYAVNAYVPPRFSVDCDLIVLNNLQEVRNILLKNGFEETISDPKRKFYRFEKDRSAFDLLVDFVLDRLTGIKIPTEIIGKYSKIRTTVGKANPLRINLRIADPEILFLMKFISCRRQDVRDIFMLSGLELDFDLIIKNLIEIARRDIIKERVRKLEKSIKRKSFRDSLQSPYGYLPDRIFNQNKANLLKILELLKKEVS